MKNSAAGSSAPRETYFGSKLWKISGFSAIQGVNDFATHADPIRKTRNYNENLFLLTVEGNPMIDKAYKMVLAAA